MYALKWNSNRKSSLYIKLLGYFQRVYAGKILFLCTVTFGPKGPRFNSSQFTVCDYMVCNTRTNLNKMIHCVSMILGTERKHEVLWEMEQLRPNDSRSDWWAELKLLAFLRPTHCTVPWIKNSFTPKSWIRDKVE